jgi:hypothetical protein
MTSYGYARVSTLDQDLCGDGTTTAVKKGGDNIGFSGHRKVKGDKVVAFCDRHCNVVAPFVSAPGNRNESPLLREALPQLTATARVVGLDLQGSIVSLDSAYDCRLNRKAIFNRGMIPNINPNVRGRTQRFAAKFARFKNPQPVACFLPAVHRLGARSRSRIWTFIFF